MALMTGAKAAAMTGARAAAMTGARAAAMTGARAAAAAGRNGTVAAVTGENGRGRVTATRAMATRVATEVATGIGGALTPRAIVGLTITREGRAKTATARIVGDPAVTMACALASVRHVITEMSMIGTLPKAGRANVSENGIGTEAERAPRTFEATANGANAIFPSPGTPSGGTLIVIGETEVAGDGVALGTAIAAGSARQGVAANAPAALAPAGAAGSPARGGGAERRSPVTGDLRNPSGPCEHNITWVTLQ